MISQMQNLTKQMNIDLESLDKFFKPNGIIQPVSTNELLKLPVKLVRIYCHIHGIYQIVTIELIEWFKSNVDLSSTIEIGAGNGTIGRALNIPITDNFLQEKPIIKKMYEAARQPIIKYSADLENLEALVAIKKHKPKNVIGAWITNIYKESEHEIGGNMYGVDELKLIQKIDKYYLLGNFNIHSNNRLLFNKNTNVQIVNAPFLHTRNHETERNFLAIITKK